MSSVVTADAQSVATTQPRGFVADLRKLLRYSSHHLAGRVIGMALGFVSFPIFTRIFTVADYGTISLLLQTVLIFTVLSKAGLQNSVQRFELELTNASAVQKQNFFSTIFLGNAAIAVLLAALFAAGVALLPSHLLEANIKRIVLLGSLLIVARAVRSMYVNMLQVEGRTVALNVLEVAIKAATILAVCLLAFLWQRAVISFFVGLVAVEFGALVLLLPTFARRTGKGLAGFDGKLLHKFIRFGVPLMWAELAWVVLDSGNRFLIQYFRGAEAVGYFSAAYNISIYTQEFILTPLNMAFFPVCVQLWTLHGEERTKEFLSRTLSYFALLAVAVIAGTTVVSSDVVVLLASKRYLQAHVLLPWLVAGLIISSLQVFFKAGLMLQHKPMKVAQATTLAAIFNMGLNVALIPRIGILGAAIATFLSYALWVFLMARAAFAVFPFAIQWPAIARYIGSAAVAWFVASRIDLPETLTRLLARGSVFCLVYAVCVLAVDKCIRHNLVRYAQECAIFSGSQQ